MSAKGDTSDRLDAGGGEAKPFKPDVKGPKPVIVKLEDVEPQEVVWLWPNRFPLGKLSLIVGDPGLGKSFLTLYMAAQVTTGRPWPDDPLGEATAEGSVIILSAEDDIADTIVPRLRDHEADRSRILAVEGVTYDDPERKGLYYFDVTRHLPALEQVITETPETRLVIIDPLTAYLGKTDSHKNAEVRSVLGPVATLAAKYKVAVIGVSHLTKDETTKAIYRTLGSVAFTGSARSVWAVSKDKGNPNRRLLTLVKANQSVDPGGLAFSIVEGVVAFEPNRIELTTDEALSPETGDDTTALREAEDFLKECLKDGQIPSAHVFNEARQNKISERTLKRAKKRLGVKSVKEGNTWLMEL